MKPTIIWFYAGVRTAKGSRRAHCFVRKDTGEEAWFFGICRISLGLAYLGMAKAMPKFPKRAYDSDPTAAQIRDWEQADLLCKEETKPVEEPLSSPEFKAAVAALQALLKDVDRLSSANAIIKQLCHAQMKRRKAWKL